MKKGLVSIITPCYNGEHFIGRYFDSVLSQTYDDIELFFINDGSTDRTEEIVLSYKEKFTQRGFDFTYIFQENEGQSSAINKGLALFSGEYLIWPDSDDALTFDAIEKKVHFLKNNPEYGGVISGVIVKDDITDKEISRFLRFVENEKKEDLFFDLLLGQNVFYAPGVYMLRSKDFLAVIPGRHIIEGRHGQNYQILLPVAYNFRFGYLKEYLYYYYIREKSHSRKANKNPIISFENTYVHENLQLNIIKAINMTPADRIRAENQVRMKHAKERYFISVKWGYAKLRNESIKQMEHISNTEALQKKHLKTLVGFIRRIYNKVLGRF